MKIAVVKVGGHQAIVSQGEIIEVDKIDAKVGATVNLEALLISETDGTGFALGAPVLKETVTAKVIEHGRGQKIRVFKMKPRKRYRRTQGHRQDYTAIEISAIGGAKKAAPKPAEKPVKEDTPAKKTTAKKSETKTTTAAKPKKVAPKEEKA